MKKLICCITLLLLVSFTLSWAALPDKASDSPKIEKRSAISVYNKEVPKVEIKRIEIPEDAKRIAIPGTPSGIRGGRVAGDLVWEDNFEPGGPYCMSYYAGVAYYWLPPPDTFAMRMTPTDNCSLDSVLVAIYLDIGAPDLRVHIYEDDGTGLPGRELDCRDVLNTNLNYFPNWTVVDFSGSLLTFSSLEDFHIGISTTGTPGDTLAFLSDDGSTNTGRASYLSSGTWSSTAYDFLIVGCVTYPDKDPWTCADGAWQWVEPSKNSPTSAHSPTHAWWVDDDTLFAPKTQLVSPWVTVPSAHSKYFLQFWYFNDFIDWDGDDDGTLEDYFKVYATEDTCAWHISSHEAYSGNSWWCGSEVYEKYGTLYFYNLTSPDIDLGAKAGGTLTFKTKYEIETPGGEPPPFDGWDVANVQISTDGWATYDFLLPDTTISPAYIVDTAYAYYANTGDIAYYPGWAGSSGGWVDASFDLSSYSGTVQIRFVVASDPVATEEGFFIDNLIVTNDGKAIVFQDDADTHINLIPDPSVLFLSDELTYDYWQDGDTTWVLEDNDQIWNGSFDISDLKGKDVKLVIEAVIDHNYDGGNGDGLWVDDVQIIGSNLPEYDMVSDFCLVPYPTTVDQDMKSDLWPKMLVHHAGYGTSSAMCKVDVEGVGHIFDYFANSAALGTDEYDLVDLTKISYTPVVGTHNYIAWVVATGDTITSNDTTTISIEVNPANYYELGYNSREWIGPYYTDTYCGTYFSPFAEGIFTAKDTAYVITGVKTLLINYGTDGATDVEGIEIYLANPDTTPGTLLYSENFNYTGGVAGTYEWAEFTLSEGVPISADFMVMIRGDWWDNPAVANYYPLFDDIIRKRFGVGAYYGHSGYWTGTGWNFYSSGDRFINAIVERKDFLYPPVVNIEISGNDVVLTWDAIAGATNYEVSYSTNPYTGFVTWHSTFGLTTYTHTDGAIVTKYFYKVKATN